MPVINTEQDWWDIVEKYWDYLIAIISDQMDMFEIAYEKPGNASSKPTGRDIGDELEFLRSNKDRKLARYFNAAWGLASDSYAYSVPHWGTLCDLCSEEYVLYEEAMS